jgi:hypothetical protein
MLPAQVRSGSERHTAIPSLKTDGVETIAFPLSSFGEFRNLAPLFLWEFVRCCNWN